MERIEIDKFDVEGSMEDETSPDVWKSDLDKCPICKENTEFVLIYGNIYDMNPGDITEPCKKCKITLVFLEQTEESFIFRKEGDR